MARTASAAASVAPAQTELLDVAIPAAAKHPKVRMITRSEIFPDPEQPRQQADAELRDSLARNGMLQPITVRPHSTELAAWMIVDGERRWRSAEGVMNDLPCIVREDMDEIARRLATQLEANTGKALTPLEEARAFGRLLTDTGASIADLAKLLGRAPSTIAERVALLELGPWLPAIERGAVVMSHAVKVLLPLRGLADELHAKVVEEMFEGDLRGDEEMGTEPMSLDSFRVQVMNRYRPFLYPLAKSKHWGARNPEFNTAKHDVECDCGGVKAAIGYEQERRYCGNPDWWKPLERAAKKAAKAKEAKSPATAKNDDKTLYMPAAAKKVNGTSYSTPGGVVQLTDSEGRWKAEQYTSGNERFDPKELVIDDAKLVYWQVYGSGYQCVGTRDQAAVKRARGAWRARFDNELRIQRDGLAQELRSERARKYAVAGPGLAALCLLLADDVGEAVLDVANALGWEVPSSVTKGNEYGVDARARDWLETLEMSRLEVMCSALAMVAGEKLTLPSVRVEELERAALANIQKRTIPWKTNPKKAKAPTKPSKAANRAVKQLAASLPLSKLSPETADLPLDDADDLTPAQLQARADDEDELWDSADDEELEEAIG